MDDEYLLTTRHRVYDAPLDLMVLVHEPCGAALINTERMHMDTVHRLISEHKGKCPAIEEIK